MTTNKLTEQEEFFIDRFLEHGVVAQACEESGLNRNSATWLMKRHKDAILERGKTKLMQFMPEAITELGGMLKDGATKSGATIRMEAIKQILDRVGLIKTEKMEVEGNVGGVMIIPMKAKEE